MFGRELAHAHAPLRSALGCDSIVNREYVRLLSSLGSVTGASVCAVVRLIMQAQSECMQTALFFLGMFIFLPFSFPLAEASASSSVHLFVPSSFACPFDGVG